MRIRPVVFGTVGLLATAVAVLLVFTPGVAGESLIAVIGSIEPAHALVLGSLVVGCCAALAGWMGGGTATASLTAYDTAIERPPEAVTAADARLVAGSVDASIEEAVDGDDEAMAAVTDRLSAAATTAYAIGTGVSRDTAREAVRAGTWTDDTVAAALLSPTEHYPLLARLRLWLDPESERRRRIRRTVTAIERLTGGEA